MPIERAPHDREHPYTKTSNAALKYLENGLDTDAHGLLTHMLMYPDDWRFNMPHLAKATGLGMAKLRTRLQKLEAAGFVKRYQYRQRSGKIKTDWWVTDMPGRYLTGYGKPHTEKPHTEKPHPEKPDPENSLLPNTDIPITNIYQETTTKGGGGGVLKHGPKTGKLADGLKTELEKQLAEIPDADRQVVLDELESAMQTKEIKSPGKYLAGLIRHYRAGTFTADGAAEVRTKREQRRRRSLLKPEPPPSAPPVSREQTGDHLKNLRGALSGASPPNPVPAKGPPLSTAGNL